MQDYTTIQGDTWDLIAKKMYNDERKADFLMANNFPLLDIFVFSAGTKVIVPDLPEKAASNLPEWRQQDG